MFAVASISWLSSKRNTLGDNVICVSVLGLFSSHFTIFGQFQMKVAVGGLTMCWGDWKHCVEVVPTGHMKEGDGVFEKGR